MPPLPTAVQAGYYYDSDGDGFDDTYVPDPWEDPAYYGYSTPPSDQDGDGWEDALDPFPADARLNPQTDPDADGVPSELEWFYGMNDLDPADGAADLDGDGFSNAEAFQQGWVLDAALVSPVPDLDGDRLNDITEAHWDQVHPGSLDPGNPLDPVADYDQDGVMNFEELTWGLDLASPTSPATGEDLAFMQLVTGDYAAFVTPGYPGYSATDPDADGLPSLLEYQLLLNPRSADSDEDGLPDGEEDTDGDGATNLAEVLAGTLPGDPASVPPPPAPPQPVTSGAPPPSPAPVYSNDADINDQSHYVVSTDQIPYFEYRGGSLYYSSGNMGGGGMWWYDDLNHNGWWDQGEPKHWDLDAADYYAQGSEWWPGGSEHFGTAQEGENRYSNLSQRGEWQHGVGIASSTGRHEWDATTSDDRPDLSLYYPEYPNGVNVNASASETRWQIDGAAKGGLETACLLEYGRMEAADGGETGLSYAVVKFRIPAGSTKAQVSVEGDGDGWGQYCQVTSDVLRLKAPLVNGEQHLARLLPVEVDSRDRAVTGKIPHLGTSMGGNKKFEIGFRGAGKNIGKFEIPQSGSPQGVHIYNSEDDIYSDSEFESGVSATNKNQEVVLIREGDGIRFYTVSDDLGQFEVLLYLDGSLIGTVSHEMKKEDGFDRMIAAAEKFIAGDDPLPIDVDYTEPPPPLAAADVPPLGNDDRQNLANNAPADVLGEFGLGSTTTTASTSEGGTTATTTSSTTTTAVTVWTDKEEFQLFVQRVFDEATTTQWSAFSGVLSNAGYNVNQALGNGQPGFNWQLGGVPATKTDIDMPDHIRNRGLVARALMYWIKRLITAHVAVGEGAVFGVWDGVKGDVDGVVETLKMPVTVFNIMKDPWKAAGELHGAFKTIKEMGWDGVKQQVKGMFDSFMSEQQGRLEWVLEGDAQDPVYLNAYMGGYLGGYIGEQVAVTVLTAGIAKGGLVGKALKQGAQIVTTTLNNAGDVGRKLHKASKSLADAFSRTARSANEGRAARRSGSLCGSINGCLAAGTYVLMANGSARLIDNVHGGDSIMADDPDDGLPPFPVAVETQIANRATSWIALGCDFNNDRKADQTLKLTPEHPVFIVDRGWVNAVEVSEGDYLREPTGSTVAVCAVHSFTANTQSFNLDVGEPNTFFASTDGQQWVLVHNGEFDIGPQRPSDMPFRRHHPIMNRWLEVHLPFTYQSRLAANRAKFPCISLTEDAHKIATRMENQFMAGRDYHDVSAYEAKRLCEQIFDAVGVPPSVRTFYFQTMNIWLHNRHKPTCP